MYVKGYFTYTWDGEWIKVEKAQLYTITLKNAPKNKINKDVARFAAVNLIEEIDVPGEWFIDKSNNKLYYYPPHKLTSDDVFEIGGMEDDIININGADNLSFEGLTLEKNYSSEAIDSAYNNKNYENGIEIKKTEKFRIAKPAVVAAAFFVQPHIAGHQIHDVCACHQFVYKLVGYGHRAPPFL